jgi:hypothetical protein
MAGGRALTRTGAWHLSALDDLAASTSEFENGYTVKWFNATTDLFNRQAGVRFQVSNGDVRDLLEGPLAARTWPKIIKTNPKDLEVDPLPFRKVCN